MMKNNLKTTLCDKLVEEGKVQEGDIVKHSYTQQILKGKKKCVEKSGEMITLTTRPDCVGVVVNENQTKRYKNYITWRNKKGEFNTECNRASLENDLALTIPTTDQTKVALRTGGGSNLRIRKLTPLETMRLMGFTDEDYQAMRDIGMSDAAIYHMAGDSIVVTVLISIFSQLMSEDKHISIVNEYIKKGIIEK